MLRLILLAFTFFFTGPKNVTAIKIRNQVSQHFQGPADLFCIESKASSKDGAKRFLNENCNMNQEKTITKSVLVSVDGNPHALTRNEVDLFGDKIKESYNEIVRCSGQYFRKVERAVLLNQLDFADKGSRQFTLEYSVTFTCRGCINNSFLFFHDVVEEEKSCPCRPPSQQLFFNRFERNFNQLSDDRSKFPNIFYLDEVSELLTLPICPAFQVLPKADVVVEFYGRPMDLTDEKLKIMADAFLETYNNLNKLNTWRCDPFFRELSDITYFFDRNNLDFDFNDFEEDERRRKTLEKKNNRRGIKARVLDEEDEEGNEDETSDDGESPEDDTQFDDSEGNDDLESTNNDDNDSEDEESPGITPEDDPQSEEEETPSITLEDDPQSEEEESPSINPEDDPQSEEEESPSITPEDNSQSEEEESPSITPDDDQSEEEESPSITPEDDSQSEEEESPSITPEDDESEEEESPSITPEDGESEENESETDDYYDYYDYESNDVYFGDDSVSFEDDDNVDDFVYFSIRFEMTARCRGCDVSTTAIFDSAEDGNFYDDDYGFENDGLSDERNLLVKGVKSQSNNGKMSGCGRKLKQSDCKCPVDAENRAITEEEMKEAYFDRLGELSIEEVEDVEDIIELEKAECSPTKDIFKTVVNITLVSSTAASTRIPRKVLKGISDTFKKSFNDLSQRYRDPKFRAVENVTVTKPTRRYLQEESSNTTLVSNNTDSTNEITFNFTYMFPFQFFVTGFCRGCPKNEKLLDDASRRRMKSQELFVAPKAINDKKYRRLQNGNQCFYSAVNFDVGSPSERVFADRYTSDLTQLFNRGNFGNNIYTVLTLEERGASTGEIPHAECSTNSDCKGGSLKFPKICVKNKCLNEGRPRVTLTWDGDDDLDLSVTTPAGTMISYNNKFDSKTGGSFDTTFAQDIDGGHVESIFFPLSGKAPGGVYKIDVLSYEERGSSDSWILEVFEKDQTEPVLREEGQGKRTGINLARFDGDASLAEAVCTKDDLVECCEDADCGEKICVNRQCVTNGYYRVSLEYYGDDDYSLIANTPSYNEIYIENAFDDETNGVYEGDKNKNEGGNTWHTQSIYFPENTLAGTFNFYVEHIEKVGIVTDTWKLSMWRNGEEVSTLTGYGDSADDIQFFVYECTTNQQCSTDDGDTCYKNECILDGTPRFNLMWNGTDDIDLSIKAPDGTEISWENNDDIEYAGEPTETSLYEGRNLEYVSFGDGAPVGMYDIDISYYHTEDNRNKNPWTLIVVVDGKETKTWSSSAGVSKFTWEYTEQTNGPIQSPIPFACFSGLNTLLSEDEGVILMKDLKLGDKILTSLDPPVYETIYSFGHFSNSQEAEYLQILPTTLEITYDHMLFTNDDPIAKPASLLQVGDQLSDGTIVKGIRKIRRQGAYAPFTSSGTLLVNGVLASNYIAFQNSKYLKVGPFRVSFQWLAHTFTYPHRFWCKYVSMCSEEKYTEMGTSLWVDLPHRMIRWWMINMASTEDEDINLRKVVPFI